MYEHRVTTLMKCSKYRGMKRKEMNEDGEVRNSGEHRSGNLGQRVTPERCGVDGKKSRLRNTANIHDGAESQFFLYNYCTFCRGELLSIFSISSLSLPIHPIQALFALISPRAEPTPICAPCRLRPLEANSPPPPHPRLHTIQSIEAGTHCPTLLNCNSLA